MRLLLIIALVLGFGLSSCEKYRLKQPAYLDFKWDFFGELSAGNDVVITEGHFYLNRIKVYGAREKGPEVEMEQHLDVCKTVFTPGGSLGLSIDIPVGDYNEFEVQLDVTDSQAPSLMIAGIYSHGEIQIPFRVEWDADIDLKFRPTENFSLKKKKRYNMVVGVNIEKLLSEVSESDWHNAIVSVENGIPTIIIRENYNQKIYIDLNAKLMESLVLKLE